MMKPLMTAVLAAGAGVAAQAWPLEASAAGQCFRTSEMQNHSVLNDHSILVAVGLHDVWRIDSKGSCFAGASRSDPLIIRTTASIGMVCQPLDLDLAVRRGTGMGGMSTHCIVDGIRKLTPAEIAATPKKLRP